MDPAKVRADAISLAMLGMQGVDDEGLQKQIFQKNFFENR